MSHDRMIPRIVVVTLALVVLAGVGFMGYLATTQTPVPDSLDRFTFGALSALGAILASTRSTSPEEPPVEVTGPSGGPVETTEATVTTDQPVKRSKP